jgi:hypothetical protein
MEAKMHFLPPQVELDATLLLLTLVALAITWLSCRLPTRDVTPLKAPKRDVVARN